MFKPAPALAAAALLACCAVSHPQSFTGAFEPPPAGSRVLLMTPDIQLGLLTAGGVAAPREDWSIAARDNLAASIGAYLAARGHRPSMLDPATAMEGRVGQLIRLHQAVGYSIRAALPLPTKKDRFEWTLGPGVSAIANAYGADYALFVSGQGHYASSGRMAAAVGLSLIGVGVPLGGQVVFASLVDLRTGDLIWFNAILAAPGQDMRDVGGARALTAELMEEAPL